MRSRTRRSLFAGMVLGLIGSLLLAAPATAAAKPTPGSFSGYAFDSCITPPQDVMDTWLERSPYWGIGVYISGNNRACKTQPNLTPTWVATQLKKGWKLLPITVGRQAQCYASSSKPERISTDPAGGYAAAYAEGVAEANATVVASRALGIPAGSTQWLDIEHFPPANVACRDSMVQFTRGWTARLNQLGYKSGFYSSASSGIAVLAAAKVAGVTSLPDQLWIAEWTGVATVSTKYLSDNLWAGQRIKQYHGDTVKKYGGKSWNIDGNWIETGGGTKAGAWRKRCGKFDVDKYPVRRTLKKGRTGNDVRAVECMLKAQGFFKGNTGTKFDTKTENAVKRFQRANNLPVNGKTTRGTRIALMAEPKRSQPLLKIGAGGKNVSRLQRALRHAVTPSLPVTGKYDAATAAAVKAYQKKRKLPTSGVATAEVWSLLARGKA